MVMKMYELMTSDPLRWLAAVGIVLGYGVLCWKKWQHAHRPMPLDHGRVDTGKEQFWVVYASQTGQAEALARQSAQMLMTDKRQVHVCRIDENWQEAVQQARCILFVVSTYGEGSAPDHARRFVQQSMHAATPRMLQGKRYGVLALGDSHYPAFCAFGRELDGWLQAAGAIPEFPRIEVDQMNAQALQQWQARLQHLGATHTVDWHTPAARYSPWHFVARQLLNEGSPGNPVYLVTLQGSAEAMPQWQPGDLVDVLVPGAEAWPRVYSIANLPGEGRLELIVRLHRRDDGSKGMASSWLTETACAGDRIQMKIRSNPGFHLEPDLSRPLILIGAGTGIAGLRAHLQARAHAMRQSGLQVPQRNAWLFFGERSIRHDYLCRLEIEDWKRQQVLSKVDLTFSRDDPVAPYVQHNLLAQSKEVCEWIRQGAQILICGNAQKMAPGVDKALRRMLGSHEVDLLLEAGRIRRDVY